MTPTGAISYRNSRSLGDGKLGYVRQLVYDVRDTPAPTYEPADRSTGHSEPRKAHERVYASLTEDAAPTHDRKRPLTLADLPTRHGAYAFVRMFTNPDAKTRSRQMVEVRCDCGHVATLARSVWVRPLACPRSCKACSWGLSRGRRKCKG